jgi:glycosyltransferase involved in cell wall biosynthesis
MLPEIRAVLVGDGPERSNLESLCRQHNLENAIVFTGNQPYQEIPRFLNQSRIFVMASAFEGLPVAMIEALSCCLPVVVPDIGDISDVAVDGYNAKMVKGYEVGDYANAIYELLTNQDLYNKLAEGACKTRQRFLEEYSLEKAKISWEDIIMSVC